MLEVLFCWMIMLFVHSIAITIDIDENRTIYDTSGYVYCGDKGDCSYSYIYNMGDGVTYCDGERACQNDKIIYGSRCFINGYLSGAWSKVINVTSIDCSGEASCHNIQQIIQYSSNGGTYCRGLRACDSLTATVFGIFAARAPLSFIHSKISLCNSDKTHIISGFFAGFNSSVFCTNGYTCKIDCSGNACFNMNLYCHINANCLVNCNENVNISCPNRYLYTLSNGINSSINDMNYINNVIIVNKSIAHQINASSTIKFSNNLFDNFNSGYDYLNDIISKKYSENGILTNEECNNVSDNNIWDNTAGNSGTKKVILNSKNDNYCCNGWYACEDNYIFTNCTDNYNSHNYDSLCNNSIVNIYCNGRFACEYMTFRIANSLRLNVYVRSLNGGEGIQVSNFDKIIASSRVGLQTSTLSNGNLVICACQFSCAFSSLSSIKYVYSLSTTGMAYTTINSNGIDMSVYLLGSNSDRTASTIICNNHDTCTVYSFTDRNNSSTNVTCDEKNKCTIKYIIVNSFDFISISFESNINYTSSNNASNINITLTHESTPITTNSTHGPRHNEKTLSTLEIVIILIACAVIFCFVLSLCCVYHKKCKTRKLDENDISTHNNLKEPILDRNSTIIEPLPKASSDIITLKNPLIIFLPIGIYNNNNKFADIAQEMSGIANVFGSKWGYYTYYKTKNGETKQEKSVKTLPKIKFKLDWSKQEINDFVNQVKEHLENDTFYDGLMFIISCQMKKKIRDDMIILDSNCEKYKLKEIYDAFASEQLQQMVKIFIIDARYKSKKQDNKEFTGNKNINNVNNTQIELMENETNINTTKSNFDLFLRSGDQDDDDHDNNARLLNIHMCKIVGLQNSLDSCSFLKLIANKFKFVQEIGDSELKKFVVSHDENLEILFSTNLQQDIRFCPADRVQI